MAPDSDRYRLAAKRTPPITFLWKTPSAEERPMPAVKNLLAFDLGAESGRALVAKFDGARLGLDVVHRFPNGAVQTLDSLYWDVLRLYAEMVAGLRKAHADHGELASMGIDTWGVDFALLGRNGTLLG